MEFERRAYLAVGVGRAFFEKRFIPGSVIGPGAIGLPPRDKTGDAPNVTKGRDADFHGRGRAVLGVARKEFQDVDAWLRKRGRGLRLGGIGESHQAWTELHSPLHLQRSILWQSIVADNTVQGYDVSERSDAEVMTRA